uniref:KAT8 regulatory NSL complex subunit 2 n=1 Tax=Cajanus cajan TaxID=3821 RepID=A0A151U7Y0_CAJCA|nr:INO80 complex subunit D [Cajanus cajan]
MRRFHNLKRLSKCYRHLYWALMEHFKTLYTHYSLNPFKLLTCAFLGCNFHPMPLTSFCHLHILSDSTQMLYKPCNYVIKGAQAGPITCGKPILRSTVPALCIAHSQKAQKHLTRALKRNSLNICSTKVKLWL